MGFFRLPDKFVTVNQYDKTEKFVYYTHGNPTWYENTRTLSVETFFERKAYLVRGNHHDPLPYHRISCKHVKPVGFGNGYGIIGSGVNVMDYPNHNGDIGSIPGMPFVSDIYKRNVVNPMFSYDDNTYNDVCTRALASLAGDNMNIGASLAEASETASYIADKAGTLFGMLRAIKKGNLSSFRKHFKRLKNGNKITARHISKTAAERWLEWKYAVTPLCSDIQSGISLFHEGLLQNRAYDRPWEIEGRAMRSVTSTNNNASPGSNQAAQVVLEAKYFCKIYGSISDGELFAASQLGLYVPSAAWELVPFSFVLDWAVPIGTFLQACNATSGLSFSRGFVTVKWNTTWKSKYKSTTPPFRFIPGAYGGVIGMVRMPLTKFPQPKVFYKSPLSTGNIITSLALFRVLFMK